MIPESDHLTLYNVYKLWEENGCSKHWCKQKFLHSSTLKKAKEIKNQLRGILKSLSIEITSTDKLDLVRKVICAAFFQNSARIKKIGEYFNLKTGLPCLVHPSSCLFSLGYIPDYIVYH